MFISEINDLPLDSSILCWHVGLLFLPLGVLFLLYTTGYCYIYFIWELQRNGFDERGVGLSQSNCPLDHRQRVSQSNSLLYHWHRHLSRTVCETIGNEISVELSTRPSATRSQSNCLLDHRQRGIVTQSTISFKQRDTNTQGRPHGSNIHRWPPGENGANRSEKLSCQ